MRLANAIALLGFVLLVSAAGVEPAEARRIYYKVDGHRYWHNSYKRRSAQRRSVRLTRSMLRKQALAKAAAKALPPKAGKPASEAATRSPMPIPVVSALPVGTAEAFEAIAVQAMPPPPGPTLVISISYDFDKGTKTVMLRDGVTFVEAFDPHSFFRIMPEAGPLATSSTVAANIP